MTPKDAKYYAANLSVDALKRKIREVEDRSTRADTMEAALADMWQLQELNAALAIQEG